MAYGISKFFKTMPEIIIQMKESIFILKDSNTMLPFGKGSRIVHKAAKITLLNYEKTAGVTIFVHRKVLKIISNVGEETSKKKNPGRNRDDF
jgi:hypothetical protein